MATMPPSRGSEMVRAYDQGSFVAFSALTWLEVALCVPGARLQADHHFVHGSGTQEVQEPDARFLPLSPASWV